jgi:hypothetical protein
MFGTLWVGFVILVNFKPIVSQGLEKVGFRRVLVNLCGQKAAL